MGEHTATVVWERNGAVFTDNRYSRAHRWHFDGGIDVPASSSPQSVPVPLSMTAAVDPVEALVAALSSCHMLWFLSIAARRGFQIERYRDEAAGVLAKDAGGRMAMTVVTLRPDATFVGERLPSRADLDAMHHEAHDRCFIANSVRSEVRIEAVTPGA